MFHFGRDEDRKVDISYGTEEDRKVGISQVQMKIGKGRHQLATEYEQAKRGPSKLTSKKHNHNFLL